MWEANHDAMHAGFGRHHAFQRRAKVAGERVADAEARIAAIHADSADIHQRLGKLDALAGNLAALAHPSTGGFGLEDLHREQLRHIDRVLHAVDVWATWADGRTLATRELAGAVTVLTETARQAPLARTAHDIDRTQWYELLEPVTGLLRRLGLDVDTGTELPLEPDGVELDIGL